MSEMGMAAGYREGFADGKAATAPPPLDAGRRRVQRRLVSSSTPRDPRPRRPDRPDVSAADKARANGWTVGTRLTGDESYGPTTIEITAIGRELVLAVTTDGTYPRREAPWDVTGRDWRDVE